MLAITLASNICNIGYGVHWQCSSIYSIWYISLQAFHISLVIYVKIMLQYNLFDLFFSHYFFFNLAFA